MNPFEKRATEHIREDLAFLPYVTSEPLLTYLQQYANDDVLFDRLAVVIGAPGSGKTTLARLFLFPTIMTLLRNTSLPDHAALTDALSKCKAIEEGSRPAVAGCRIPLESDYRDCWELPYDESIRHNLMFSLIQARAVLAWLRGFEDAGFPLTEVTLIPRPDATATLEAIGGTSLDNIRSNARIVERDVYRVTAGLLPPSQDKLPSGATNAYRPFDVIDSFEVRIDQSRVRLKPLVICDDAHVLHPAQLDSLLKWLARREIRVSRWVLTRIDALQPHAVLRPRNDHVAEGPGFNRSRELIAIWMQSSGDRAANRRSFRKIAKDMCGKYLRQMPVFERLGLVNLEDMLQDEPSPLAAGKVKQLQESLSTGHRKLIGTTIRSEIEASVDTYLAGVERRAARPDHPEIRLMMIKILMERYLKRIPQSSLFGDSVDVAPTLPVRADSTVRNAAAMQLFHEYGRPFFYSFDILCDAATENAEKFLRLAGQLVSQLETQIIRNAGNKLSAAVQDKLMRERANRMLIEEDLPERDRVLGLCEVIAKQCLGSANEPNASLGEGANAWGVLQTDFDIIPTTHPDLARVLQSGVAYNLFTLVRDYGTKGETWCLLELSGVWSLAKGLSLKRGQFLERKISDLLSAISPKVDGAP